VIGGDGNGKGKGHTIAASGMTTIHGGKAVFTHIAGEHNVFTAGRQSDTMTGALHDAKGGSDLFKLDATAHSSHMITAFSNKGDTVSISHVTDREIKAGLHHATITGGGAHTTTIFSADNTKITIIGDRVLGSDIKPGH
jgi:hypothetical protein